jgi:GTPase involved in cell partitioning and DNA repair
VRCRTLLLVVDTAGSEGRDPVEDAKKIREELRLYDPLLARRPWALQRAAQLSALVEDCGAAQVYLAELEAAGAGESVTDLRARCPRP